MSETVQIKDSADTWLKLEIFTAFTLQLSSNLSKQGNYSMFRPGSLWKGNWSASDRGLISSVSGDIWYKRSSGDILSGNVVLDIRHLDIFLFNGSDAGEDDWVIKLESFISINGTTSSGGRGYINQPWALQIKPGPVSWDCRERYQDRTIFPKKLSDD